MSVQTRTLLVAARTQLDAVRKAREFIVEEGRTVLWADSAHEMLVVGLRKSHVWQVKVTYT